MAVILLICGCAWSPGFEDRAAFDRERQLWLDQDIQNYSFWTEIGMPDYMMSGGRVFVQDGSVRCTCRYPANATNCYKPNALGSTDDLFSHMTQISISEIYAEIERYADAGRVEVQYSSLLHYPKYMKCRMSYNDFRSIYISSFTLDPELPPGAP
jgi:hypothetical protein